MILFLVGQDYLSNHRTRFAPGDFIGSEIIWSLTEESAEGAESEHLDQILTGHAGPFAKAWYVLNH